MSYREHAETRAAALWKHYNETGKLSLADFKRIADGSYDTVTKTFETYGLAAPPVYNSRKEKMRLKATALSEKAKQLGLDFLTIKQAASVLGTKPSRVISIEGRLLRYGFGIPDIVMDTEKSKPAKQEKYDNAYTEFPGKLNGTIDPWTYPAGLQVMPLYFDQINDEIHYLVI